MTLHIYRVGRSEPIRSWNPNKSRIKIQLLTRIGRFGPVWPPLDQSDRSDRGAGRPGGITSSSGLQIGRSIYAFQLSRQNLCNGTVQLMIWQTFPDRSDRSVQIVQKTWIVQILGVNICPLFLGKACVSRNVSPNKNCTETIRSTCAPVTSSL